MRALAGVLALLTLVLCAATASAYPLTATGELRDPTDTGKAALRIRGTAQSDLSLTRFAGTFRCRGKACLFPRGRFEGYCVVGGVAFGHITSGFSLLECDWEGSCAGRVWRGAVTCPYTTRSGVLALRTRRPR